MLEILVMVDLAQAMLIGFRILVQAAEAVGMVVVQDLLQKVALKDMELEVLVMFILHLQHQIIRLNAY